MTDFSKFPRDWYWVIIDEQDTIYGSAADADVVDPPNDATYQAWLAAGGVPTRIASRAELEEVLVKAGLRDDPTEVINRVLAGTATKEDGLKVVIALAKLHRDDSSRTNTQMRDAIVALMS